MYEELTELIVETGAHGLNGDTLNGVNATWWDHPRHSIANAAAKLHVGWTRVVKDPNEFHDLAGAVSQVGRIVGSGCPFGPGARVDEDKPRRKWTGIP